MSNYEDINFKKVFVSAEPTSMTITPSSGKYKDQETNLTQFSVAKPNWVKDADGKFENKGSEFYDVNIYGDEGKKIAELLKKGMVVNIEGSMTEKKWNNEEGKAFSKNVINAKDISLNLSQKRLKSIEFEAQPVKETSKTTTKAPSSTLEK